MNMLFSLCYYRRFTAVVAAAFLVMLLVSGLAAADFRSNTLEGDPESHPTQPLLDPFYSISKHLQCKGAGATGHGVCCTVYFPDTYTEEWKDGINTVMKDIACDDPGCGDCNCCVGM